MALVNSCLVVITVINHICDNQCFQNLLMSHSWLGTGLMASVLFNCRHSESCGVLELSLM